GTPTYMAPEQAAGRKDLDGRADLFSLGVILYRACTGVLPFEGTDVMATLFALASHQPAPPAELNPAVPGALSDLIMRLLTKNREGRAPPAKEAAEALLDIERGGRPAAAPVVTPARTGDEPTVRLEPAGGRRRIAWVVALAVAVVVGLVATVGGL